MIGPQETPPPLVKLDKSLIDEICNSLGRTSSEIFVLWNEARQTVAFDPATKKPAHWTNRKAAEHIAKQTGDIVLTLNNAIRRRIKFAHSK